MIICMPTVLTELHSLPEVWILGKVMCKLVPFTEMMVAHGSILTILAITFERYYAICRPLMAGYTCTKMRAMAIIVVIWIVAISITCPMLFITEYEHTTYIDGTEVPVCITDMQSVWQKIYFFGVTTFLFFIPLLVLIVIYGIIAKRLVESQRVLASPVADSQIKARKQVIFMLAAVVLCFFLCLMPFRIFTIWLLVAPEHQLKELGMESYYNLLYFCRIMLYINSAVNPILYNVISSRFRDAFIRLFSCKNDKSLKRQFTLTSYTTFTMYGSLKTKQKICLSLNGITHIENKKDETFV
ncbi:growth hormone secretagogue receptor type 1-like [Centruroides vittatus]|uniref:growth hormone secretagogue receptor type 1-like n=1 Tax=Centruroides vittatus TaxID=120091 RepID=UPI00350FD5F4